MSPADAVAPSSPGPLVPRAPARTRHAAAPVARLLNGSSRSGHAAAAACTPPMHTSPSAAPVRRAARRPRLRPRSEGSTGRLTPTYLNPRPAALALPFACSLLRLPVAVGRRAPPSVWGGVISRQPASHRPSRALAHACPPAALGGGGGSGPDGPFDQPAGPQRRRRERVVGQIGRRNTVILWPPSFSANTD